MKVLTAAPPATHFWTGLSVPPFSFFQKVVGLSMLSKMLGENMSGEEGVSSPDKIGSKEPA